MGIIGGWFWIILGNMKNEVLDDFRKSSSDRLSKYAARRIGGHYGLIAGVLACAICYGIGWLFSLTNFQTPGWSSLFWFTKVSPWIILTPTVGFLGFSWLSCRTVAVRILLYKGNYAIWGGLAGSIAFGLTGLLVSVVEVIVYSNYLGWFEHLPMAFTRAIVIGMVGSIPSGLVGIVFGGYIHRHQK